jgi:hypothetical protein
MCIAVIGTETPSPRQHFDVVHSRIYEPDMMPFMSGFSMLEWYGFKFSSESSHFEGYSVHFAKYK